MINSRLIWRNEMEKAKKTSIEINSAWCKACGICAGLCPKGVYTRDSFGKPVIKHLDRCIMCKLCELRCPDFAIRVGRME